MLDQSHLDKIQIPHDWTGNQAKTVIDLLENIALTIWDVHGNAILEDHDQQNLKIAPPPIEDDYPF